MARSRMSSASVAESLKADASLLTGKMLLPVLAFLSAGLSKLVNWDIPPMAVFLLVCYGIVAYGLNKVPQGSAQWIAPPGSSLAKLKQTIATLRAIVTIVIMVFILLLLATSRTLTNQLPAQLAGTVETLVQSPDSKDAIVLKLAEPVRSEKGVSVYFGSIDRAGNTVTSDASPMLRATPVSSAGSPPQLYVIAAPSLLKRMVDVTIVPLFFSVATLFLVFVALFTGVIFGMEIFGGVQLELDDRRNGRRG